MVPEDGRRVQEGDTTNSCGHLNNKHTHVHTPAGHSIRAALHQGIELQKTSIPRTEMGYGIKPFSGLEVQLQQISKSTNEGKHNRKSTGNRPSLS